jgi:hypothetical protein
MTVPSTGRKREESKMMQAVSAVAPTSPLRKYRDLRGGASVLSET